MHKARGLINLFDTSGARITSCGPPGSAVAAAGGASVHEGGGLIKYFDTPGAKITPLWLLRTPWVHEGRGLIKF